MFLTQIHKAVPLHQQLSPKSQLKGLQERRSPIQRNVRLGSNREESQPLITDSREAKKDGGSRMEFWRFSQGMCERKVERETSDCSSYLALMVFVLLVSSIGWCRWVCVTGLNKQEHLSVLARASGTPCIFVCNGLTWQWTDLWKSTYQSRDSHLKSSLKFLSPGQERRYYVTASMDGM